MSFSAPNILAEYFFGIPGVSEQLKEVFGQEPNTRHWGLTVTSFTVQYPSTSGPYGGLGGAALSDFQMTAIMGTDFLVVFADDRLYTVSVDTEEIKLFRETFVENPYKAVADLPRWTKK